MNASGITLNDLLAGLSNQFPVVESEVVRRALEQEKAASAEKAVTIMRGLIKAGLDSIRASAVQLKAAMANVARSEQNLYALDRAVQFMVQTGNPLPFYKHGGNMRDAANFCSQIGIELPADESDAWIVPADFVAPTSANVAAVAAVEVPNV